MEKEKKKREVLEENETELREQIEELQVILSEFKTQFPQNELGEAKKKLDIAEMFKEKLKEVLPL